MQLLDMAADQSLSSQLAKFSFEAQFACQSFCENQMRQDKEGSEETIQ